MNVIMWSERVYRMSTEYYVNGPHLKLNKHPTWNLQDDDGHTIELENDRFVVVVGEESGSVVLDGQVHKLDARTAYVMDLNEEASIYRAEPGSTIET